MLLTSATFACTNSCCLHPNHHNQRHPSQAFEERGAITAPSRHPCSPWDCPDRRPAQPNQGLTPDAAKACAVRCHVSGPPKAQDKWSIDGHHRTCTLQAGRQYLFM